MQFISSKISAGVWQGDLSGAGDQTPDLQVTHLGHLIDQVTYSRDAAHDIWRVSVILPKELLNDGVQTCVISDHSGKTVETFTVICGDVLTDDLRAEIALLRSELELLQKAFRKHCSES